MKAIVLSIVGGSVLIAVVILMSGQKGDSAPATKTNSVDNVSMSDGKQVVEIAVKGGYTPRSTIAKANTPTILRMKTAGTFDCSSALTIPSIGYKKNLKPSEATDIEIPPQETGTILQGMCSMGMYSFEVAFN